ncbi:hypothetical protein CAOG_004075 [Capsaspora owczarzaki ATCC 30864]|uniref:Uncharacterized protein n=1 Tax=Capsaspora owczarzaki (strain ATCC 30864) TaxID=595528 RepID=A0A0D2WQL5_CAPO3|nr:hypothetical protein CAOG_004075 [Capsaspora owczarzaki ATCC 30864]
MLTGNPVARAAAPTSPTQAQQSLLHSTSMHESGGQGEPADDGAATLASAGFPAISTGESSAAPLPTAFLAQFAHSSQSQPRSSGQTASSSSQAFSQAGLLHSSDTTAAASQAPSNPSLSMASSSDNVPDDFPLASSPVSSNSKSSHQSSGSGSIKPIDARSVHRICSGQVILSLATAVKELVENSIDAGATAIEIRLREHGAELIEVIDNGSGIEPHNFQALTLKYHTSKLADFSDLTRLETFGFRGEALSSLCALAEVSVTTCSAAHAVGTRLEFDTEGLITTKSPCPREQGTTISVRNIFASLPVRYRELMKNLKREYGKLIAMLQAYCIVATGVRISCSNQIGKTPRSMVFASPGAETMKDNVTAIFGIKQTQQLMPFVQLSSSELTAALATTDAGSSQVIFPTFKITGLISKPMAGCGRSSTDRQCFYVNGRPCDMPKLSKVANEIYHSFIAGSFPALFLNLALPSAAIDVNVTPDKRTILLHDEKELVLAFKTCLSAMYEPTRSTFALHTLLRSTAEPTEAGSLNKSASNHSDGVAQKPHTTPAAPRATASAAKPTHQSSFARVDVAHPTISRSSSLAPPAVTKTPTLINHRTVSGLSMSQLSARLSTEPVLLGRRSTFSNSSASLVPPTRPLSSFSARHASIGQPAARPIEPSGPGLGVGSNPLLVGGLDPISLLRSHLTNVASNASAGVPVTKKPRLMQDEQEQQQEEEEPGDADLDDFADRPAATGASRLQMIENLTSHDSGEENDPESLRRRLRLVPDAKPAKPVELDQYLEKVPSENTSASSIKSVAHLEVAFQLASIAPRRLFVQQQQAKAEAALARAAPVRSTAAAAAAAAAVDGTVDSESAVDAKVSEEGAGDNSPRKFRTKISPQSEQAAVAELARSIFKTDFAKMKVLGQFNRGFIIAKLDKDLFLVDQHATDEKYNYEKLQESVRLQSQPLIRPMPLQLTAANEVVLMDNIDIFRMNGFDFVVDESAPATERVRLSAMPFSKKTTFGPSDVDELLYRLSDSPGVMCRPSRVASMLASRACRKSVMIGDPLSTSQMYRLLRHMGQIEQPWNCPHGRPTMRHLLDLSMISFGSTQQPGPAEPPSPGHALRISPIILDEEHGGLSEATAQPEPMACDHESEHDESHGIDGHACDHHDAMLD